MKTQTTKLLDIVNNSNTLEEMVKAILQEDIVKTKTFFDYPYSIVDFSLRWIFQAVHAEFMKKYGDKIGLHLNQDEKSGVWSIELKSILAEDVTYVSVRQHFIGYHKENEVWNKRPLDIFNDMYQVIKKLHSVINKTL